MFKNFRYHSSNQTIRIVKGQISWRYWIRRPTEEYELSGARVGAEENERTSHVSTVLPRIEVYLVKKSRWPLSCRIHISIQGLEWFLYNRTAAYDNIIAQMEADPTRPSYSEEELNRSIGLRAGTSRVSAAADGVSSRSIARLFHLCSPVYPPTAFPTSASVLAKAPSLVKRGAEWMKSQLPSLKLTDLLPVSIEADKGAILCGNVSTPNLLVAEFKDAEGTFGVVPVRSSVCFVVFLIYSRHIVSLEIRFLQANAQCQVQGRVNALRCQRRLCRTNAFYRRRYSRSGTTSAVSTPYRCFVL